MGLLFISWNFTVANMDLSVIEGSEGSEFNCEVSPLFETLRFEVDTLRGVLFAIDRCVAVDCHMLSYVCLMITSFIGQRCKQWRQCAMGEKGW